MHQESQPAHPTVLSVVLGTLLKTVGTKGIDVNTSVLHMLKCDEVDINTVVL